MAREVNLGTDDELFIGEDKILDLEVLDRDGVPVDIAGWTGTFDMRETDHAATAMIAAALTVVGTYNVDPAVNTQAFRASLTDDAHTTLFGAGTYRYSFKRMTAGAETILAFGSITWQEATQK